MSLKRFGGLLLISLLATAFIFGTIFGVNYSMENKITKNVNSGETFELSKGQTAFVKDANIRVKFVKWNQAFQPQPKDGYLDFGNPQPTYTLLINEKEHTEWWRDEDIDGEYKLWIKNKESNENVVKMIIYKKSECGKIDDGEVKRWCLKGM